MHDFRVNIKRQEIVLIVAHQPTGAEQLLNKLSPSSSGAAALGFFFFFLLKELSRAECGAAGGGPPWLPELRTVPALTKYNLSEITRHHGLPSAPRLGL